ncbi:hypothetical protein H8E50_01430, partial [bacterium]|nr:hypothetical protein [bacterium]
GIYNVYEMISSGIGSLYGKTASGVGNVYDSTAAGIGKLTKLNPFRSSRINAIETRMEKIETWIEEIKDKGFIIAGPTAEAPAKKLSEGQEALLKNILLDNLDLMR